MADDDILDVYDIAGLRRVELAAQHPRYGDHWYWCRRHQRAEHVGWAMLGCVRIGPFMSEREANRLNEIQVTLSPVSGHYKTRAALGMEAE